MNKGAFADFCTAITEDAFAAASHNLAVELGLATGKYKYKIKLPPTWVIKYEVINDFEYHHIDQDVNNGKYIFKKGEIIELRLDTDPMYFMPDRSNLQWKAVVAKKCGQR